VADRNADLLAACLRSVERNVGTAVPFEAIIVLNGSPEPVTRLVHEGLAGVKVVESSVNRGVAGGYNLGRDSAQGEFLVLLHDDVEVWPGWLEALVEAADECPEAGAVGSRALNPDGTLQAAGAIVWRDGMTHAVGRGEPADTPAYRVRRRVDYSGSNSLLVRTGTWDAVGGLDERFFPAYHVDVDLGMKIRDYGQVVLYEPRSQVTHHRWGFETAWSYRLFAGHRNQRLFVEKWGSALEAHVPRDDEAVEEALARVEHERPGRAAPSARSEPRSDLDYLRDELAVKDAYISELERRHAEASEAARDAEHLRQQLEGIRNSRMWRLHDRLLPLFRLISRIKPSGSAVP
jgi:GT2 family glycosyltransferase